MGGHAAASHPLLTLCRHRCSPARLLSSILLLSPPSQTLYLSKNALRSLEGVQQFGPSLRALSAADNLLADLHALEPLRGLGLVAASFEGNPVADLPLYRQHAISILGPGLQVLDSRAVGEEERHAAAAAVAHEDKLLQLMVANSCLVQVCVC